MSHRTSDHSGVARERRKIVAKKSCERTANELSETRSPVLVLIFALGCSIAVGHKVGQAGWPSGQLARGLLATESHPGAEPVDIQLADRLCPYLIRCLPYVSKY